MLNKFQFNIHHSKFNISKKKVVIRPEHVRKNKSEIN